MWAILPNGKMPTGFCALDRLERIMEPPTPRSQHEHMVHDSDLDGLREHPRYLKLLKRLGL